MINGIFTMETSYVASSNSASGDGTRYFRLTNIKEGDAIFRLVYANATTYNGSFDSADTGDLKWSFPIVVAANTKNTTVNAPASITVTAPLINAQVNTTTPVKPAKNVNSNSTNTVPKPVNTTSPKPKIP